MARNRSLPPRLGRSSLSKLEREFHLQYGQTLAAWARLEQTLSRLFCVICEFGDDPLGPELFFSGRSFQTRADLLSAAIRVAELSEPVKQLARAVRKKARDYSGQRNKIAHGYPSHMIFADVEWQGWRIKEGEQSHLPGGIGIAELQNAYRNFLDLEMIAESVIMLVKNYLAEGLEWPPPQERLMQAQELPPDAFLPSRYQSEAERPPLDG